MRKNHIAAVFIFLLCTLASIHAEAKTYTDKEKGYNVVVDISLLAENMNTDDIKEYSQTLFDWCNTKGKNTKILNRIPDDIVWGINKGLSECNYKKGESYSVITFRGSENNLDMYTMIAVFLTINDKKSYKVETIVETYINVASENKTVEETDGVFSNAALGYKGYAKMNYEGINLSDEYLTKLVRFYYDFANKDNYIGHEIELTKEQSWLLNQALKKYNLKQNEVYTGYIGVEPKSFPAPVSLVVVVVTIKDVKSYGDFHYRYIAIESMEMDE